MVANLAQLQAQLTELQAQSRLPATNVVPFTPNQHQGYPTVSEILAGLNDTINTTVKNAISGEITELKKVLNITEKVEPVKKEYTILEAVGLALTPEEQLWLSKEENLKRIPGFMVTPEGQEFTKMFISDFKESLGE